jgi:hypothetical protein
MSALIDDLLRLSYSSRAPLILAHMDLNQLVADVIAELRDAQTTHEKVTWTCEAADRGRRCIAVAAGIRKSTVQRREVFAAKSFSGGGRWRRREGRGRVDDFCAR